MLSFYINVIIILKMELKQRHLAIPLPLAIKILQFFCLHNNDKNILKHLGKGKKKTNYSFSYYQLDNNSRYLEENIFIFYFLFFWEIVNKKNGKNYQFLFFDRNGQCKSSTIRNFWVLVWSMYIQQLTL